MSKEIKSIKEIEIDKLLMRLRNGMTCTHQEIINVIEFYREKTKDLQNQYNELSKEFWSLVKYHQ